jgi:two-component system sensor histidine kinase VicK
MQTEFINVAVHELRTPIQPILSLSQLVYSNIKDIEQRELLDTVIRNAKRLHRLTEEFCFKASHANNRNIYLLN